MADWRETDGDEWGPTRFEWDVTAQPAVARVTRGNVVAECAPIDIIRALLRAHDLRAKAPGTECRRCKGWGFNCDLNDGPCQRCHGSGRALTPDELKRWRERTGR